MRKYGISTGTISHDFMQAFTLFHDLAEVGYIKAVELSALRMHELWPLLKLLTGMCGPPLDLRPFEHVSVHAPTKFSAEEERELAAVLQVLVPPHIPVVVHAEDISVPARGEGLGDRLYIENADRRKITGKFCRSFEELFTALPKAKLCFDIAHAYNVDCSMHEALRFVNMFRDRIAEVHVSGITEDRHATHIPLTRRMAEIYYHVCYFIADTVPIISESPLDVADYRSSAIASLIPMTLTSSSA